MDPNERLHYPEEELLDEIRVVSMNRKNIL